LSKSPPRSADKPTTFDAISVHARSLQDIEGKTSLVSMHAEVCAKRQIEIKDQELREFVVKHSVMRIHCMLVLAMILIAMELFGPVRADALAAFVAVASLVIATSTKSIARALANQQT
jgi:hypothetical protein